ncbi:MAG: RNA degradosome polyphosphate kinase, partial [Deltaproteobacteria bacterium]
MDVVSNGVPSVDAAKKAVKQKKARPKSTKPKAGKQKDDKSKKAKPKVAKQKAPKSKVPKTKGVKPKTVKSSPAKPKSGKPKSPMPESAKTKAATKAKKDTPVPGATQFDLSDSQWYMNRELTWLSFNRRVLHEAEDDRTPLLERLKFIAIVSANLDEFFMKRIGGLKQQIGVGMRELTLDGRTARQQVNECHAVIRDLEAHKEELFRNVCAMLEEKNILIEQFADLMPKERKLLREQYYANIFPLLTPQSIDPAHPFPFISNLSLNLLVAVRYPKARDVSLVRVKVPTGLGTPRFIRVGKGDHFVRLEDIMMNNLDMLFPGMEVVSCEIFRVTRNANTEKDEDEADDLMEMIESELKERKFAPIVRLEIGTGMEPFHRGRLAAELELDEENDVFE